MKKIVVLSISVLMISMMLVSSVSATTTTLNLPDQEVTITTVALGSQSFFNATLSGVPIGYDVENGDYLGWCTDLSHMDLPPSPRTVRLFSSYDIPTEFAGEIWATESWDMVNYILNNKPEVIDTGDIYDIQMAIWNFVDNIAGDGDHNPNRDPSADSLALIADAYANGAGFVPTEGDIIAVICVPEGAAQITIIEVQIPEVYGNEGLTPGFWKNHACCWMGYSPCDKFSDVFGVTITVRVGRWHVTDPTLMQALRAKGGVNEDIGEYGALARHAVAAILNAKHDELAYPMSESQIISQVAEAIGNDDLTDAEPLKNLLDMYNNLGGDIDCCCNIICRIIQTILNFLFSL